MDIRETTHKLQEITRAAALLLEHADWTPVKVTVTPDALAIHVSAADGTVTEHQVIRMAHDWQIIHVSSTNTGQSLYRTNSPERIVAHWARTLIAEIG